MEFQYIKIILKRTGLIHNSTPLSLANWFSPSHPLQPSIFHYMELFHSTTVNQCSRLSHRCNRKLIFQLVNELLVEILKPYINPKPWIRRRCGGGVVNRRKIYGGAELIEEICRKIKNFPLANCQVLEDIDGLIDGDLRKSDVGLIVSSSSSSWSWEDYEEVGERIALEIELRIFSKKRWLYFPWGTHNSELLAKNLQHETRREEPETESIADRTKARYVDLITHIAEDSAVFH
ncbi:hypothetical protein M9H77_10522 [Catharanthus roseus]|uniref:Uncharacterized protein n=1 Tax=Catharanthus roseus TaxID=4058 RepID=A0ACC0BBZ1_CATRO|nr:hypothetical protein M9H77_10522 [Catharanthus roseus]